MSDRVRSFMGRASSFLVRRSPPGPKVLNPDLVALRLPMPREHFAYQAPVTLVGFSLRAKERDFSLKERGI